MSTRLKNCTSCGEPFDEEEREGPHYERTDKGKNIRSRPICDQCFHDEYEFTCCWCKEYGDVEDQHKMLVVFEECANFDNRDARILPGLYRITDGPYYGGPLIGSQWLYGDSLERIKDLRPDMDGSGYPCGHLCAGCQEKCAKPITQEERDQWERSDLFDRLSKASTDENRADIIEDLGLARRGEKPINLRDSYNKLPLEKIRAVAAKYLKEEVVST